MGENLGTAGFTGGWLRDCEPLGIGRGFVGRKPPAGVIDNLWEGKGRKCFRESVDGETRGNGRLEETRVERELSQGP